MDFPLATPNTTEMDYFAPLHVDTRIEYNLNMEKFPELTDPLHYWEPALLIDSQRSLPSETSQVNLTEGSAEIIQDQTYTIEAQEELYQLIESLEIDVPESVTVEGTLEVDPDVFRLNSAYSENDHCGEVQTSSRLSPDCRLSKCMPTCAIDFHNTWFECNAEIPDRATSCIHPQAPCSCQSNGRPTHLHMMTSVKGRRRPLNMVWAPVTWRCGAT